MAADEAGVTVYELSAKTGIEIGKLGRILRFLATKHIFREGKQAHWLFREVHLILYLSVSVKRDVFVNNRLSMLLDSGNELSSLSLHLLVLSFYI